MSAAAGDLLAPDGLPVGPCPRCEREVVAVVALAADGESEAWACGHCDGPVRAVTFVAEGELGRLGYDLRDPLAAGCATGCAAGGCGAGPRPAATPPASIDEMLARHARLRR